MKILPIAAALVLAGCATTYDMSVMPRDSGRMYSGIATDNGTGEGRVTIEIEGKTFSGQWVALSPDRANAWITGGFGTSVLIDNPYGQESKALLTAQDGSGMRCDLRTGQGYGGGTCRDDRGREYDVQLRPARRG